MIFIMKEIKLYQEKVNTIINNFIEKEISNNQLKEMIYWSIKGGKRLRSMIVLDIANSMDNIHQTISNVNKASICCEFSHTSSLIIDDLPCMDNDNYRRDIETIHFKYGVNNAYILANYLLSRSTTLIYDNLEEIENDNKEKTEQIQKYLINNYLENYNTCILGQYVDIYPLQKSKEGTINFTGVIKDDYLRKIIVDKTAPFFEMSFMSGYLLSGGDINNCSQIKKISQLFGLIFQISDDFEDQEQDLKKSCQSLIQNYVLIIGKEQAVEDFHKYKDLFIIEMENLNLYSELFKNIIEYLIQKVNKYK